MPAHHTAAYWKAKLDMLSHPEGGCYKEIYRSPMLLPQRVLTPEHNGDRNAMTSIYFMLEQGEKSALHRIASDELWHHYDGDTLEVYEITAGGVLTTHLLGKDNGAAPFVLIQAGSWFGSRVAAGGTFTLCGCTVAPGFDFADFEMADAATLSGIYPQHEALISEMC